MNKGKLEIVNEKENKKKKNLQSSQSIKIPSVFEKENA